MGSIQPTCCWSAILSAGGGGSACGADGFWGRWMDYAANGHGGNVDMRALDQSDFRVSILEVAGSADTDADIRAAERLLKLKLKSHIFGLNKNL